MQHPRRPHGKGMGMAVAVPAYMGMHASCSLPQLCSKSLTLGVCFERQACKGKGKVATGMLSSVE